VVGGHGRGELPGMHLGAVASYCTHHAPCPVVVVHQTGLKKAVTTYRELRFGPCPVRVVFAAGNMQMRPGDLTAQRPGIRSERIMGVIDNVEPPLAALCGGGDWNPGTPAGAVSTLPGRYSHGWM